MILDYRIETDPRRCFVHLVLMGHWTLETVAAYRHDLERAFRAMASAGCVGGYRSLVDLREHGIQSRVVAEALQAVVEEFGIVQRRMAILCGESALHRFQALRIVSEGERLVFTGEREAMDWLLAGEKRVAASG